MILGKICVEQQNILAKDVHSEITELKNTITELQQTVLVLQATINQLSRQAMQSMQMSERILTALANNSDLASSDHMAANTTNQIIVSNSSSSSNEIIPTRRRVQSSILAFSTSSVIRGPAIAGNDWLSESLTNRNIQQLYYTWYVFTLHLCETPTNSESGRRMSQFATLIYYSKRFLPNNTTISQMPTDAQQKVTWINQISNQSRQVQSSIIRFFSTNATNGSKCPSMTITSLTKLFRDVPIENLPINVDVTDFATTAKWNYNTEQMTLAKSKRDQQREKKRLRNAASVADEAADEDDEEA